ncbi:hypothetical protein OH76DRAFT_161187 [Lentinus brumalis]|uniref:Uncharacterized protein n=1 Tax=Lentinus brumalis TaxID=2498619 RepID=A0A371DIW8_9APHY|nr:hypothetical protein OH76DRAFT_161187 [Polyporus brumalis]
MVMVAYSNSFVEPGFPTQRRIAMGISLRCSWPLACHVRVVCSSGSQMREDVCCALSSERCVPHLRVCLRDDVLRGLSYAAACCMYICPTPMPTYDGRLKERSDALRIPIPRHIREDDCRWLGCGGPGTGSSMGAVGPGALQLRDDFTTWTPMPLAWTEPEPLYNVLLRVCGADRMGRGSRGSRSWTCMMSMCSQRARWGELCLRCSSTCSWRRSEGCHLRGQIETF